MQNEPTDSSAQHFPANNILPLCRETRKTASFQQATRVISFVSPNELSLVFHFAPFSSLFVTASFLYYSQKCVFFFPFWHIWCSPSPPFPLGSLTCQLSRSNDIFFWVFWTSADILDSSSQRLITLF